jgi:hypothetical protein
MSWTAADFAEMIGAFRREFAGAIRRMVISRASGGIWQLAGHVLFDVTRRETREVELYPGIGTYSEPPSTGSPEAIAVQVGGPNNPAIVATRDEATRQKIADVAGAGDQFVGYNSQARVWVKPDGTIEARAHAGVAVALATKADLDALRNYIANTMTLPVSGATAGPIAAPAVPNSTGTTKFKAQ